MIPVTLLTGFLGSGKTTLLQKLLKQPSLSRTAVVINELGEIGLDHELVAKSDEDFIELTTGCLCCKVQSDLVATLDNMLARRDAGTVMAFDRIVIETTGLADPAPILHALMTTPSLIARVALGSIVVTVDAMTGTRTLEREAVSVKQVAVADRLVITKTDLAGGIPGPLVQQLDEINRHAPRLAVVAGMADANLLVKAADSLDESMLRGWQSQALSEMPVGAHLDGITSFVLVREAPLPALALTLFLEALAEHGGPDLLRLKGLVGIEEAPGRPAVIHGVQHVFHPPEWLDRWPSGDWRTRLVFITRGISQRWVSALLAAIEREVVERRAMP